MVGMLFVHCASHAAGRVVQWDSRRCWSVCLHVDRASSGSGSALLTRFSAKLRDTTMPMMAMLVGISNQNGMP